MQAGWYDPAMSARLATALAAALITPLGGCAWLLGHAEAPQPRDPVRPLPATVRAAGGPLALTATWLGVGERVVTARNVWGRVGRVVNAFGEDTFRVRVELRATGPEPVVVLPERATLADEAGPPRPARTLAAFRARWPGWAVTNDEQEADRKAAYEHVLGLLLIEREIAPGAETSGIVAFPAFAAKRKLVMRLPYRVGFKPHEAVATWEGL